MTTLVDSNVLLDLFTDDPTWYRWSRGELERLLKGEGASINPIIYAELCLAFARAADLDQELDRLRIERLALPYQAACRAAQAFLRYRRAGGTRRSPLPDFYIGAHAETARITLVTRDAGRYRSYFPRLRLRSPKA